MKSDFPYGVCLTTSFLLYPWCSMKSMYQNKPREMRFHVLPTAYLYTIVICAWASHKCSVQGSGGSLFLSCLYLLDIYSQLVAVRNKRFFLPKGRQLWYCWGHKFVRVFTDRPLVIQHSLERTWNYYLIILCFNNSAKSLLKTLWKMGKCW